MKQLACFVFTMYALSCTKKESIPADEISKHGSIQYRINGGFTKIDNVNLANGEKVKFEKQQQVYGSPPPRYVLNAQKTPEVYLTFTILTDSLNETDYHYDSSSINNNFIDFTFDLDHRGQFMSLYFSTDSMDIKITSYKDARISGTFSATFSIVTGSRSDYKTRGSIYITEGQLNNVPVTYR